MTQIENKKIVTRVNTVWRGEDGIARVIYVPSAVAIIVDTPVSRVLGNFYLGVSKPHVASQLFTSEDDALDWLEGYIV